MLSVSAIRRDLSRGRKSEGGRPALTEDASTNVRQALQDVGRSNRVLPREANNPLAQVSTAPGLPVQAEGDRPSGLFRNHRARLAVDTNNANALLELLRREFPPPTYEQRGPLTDFTGLAAIYPQHNGTFNSGE